MSKRIYIILVAAAVAAGCGQKKAERFTALPFPDITLPSMIQSQQDAAEYYAVHYWDKMTDPERVYPSDSLLVSGVRKDDLEQKYANWIGVLDLVDLKTSEKAIKNLYDKALICEKKNGASNVASVSYPSATGMTVNASAGTIHIGSTCPAGTYHVTNGDKTVSFIVKD